MRALAEQWQEKGVEEDWGGPPRYHLQMLGEWLTDEYPWESARDAEVFLILRETAIVGGAPPRLTRRWNCDLLYYVLTMGVRGNLLTRVSQHSIDASSSPR